MAIKRSEPTRAAMKIIEPVESESDYQSGSGMNTRQITNLSAK